LVDDATLDADLLDRFCRLLQEAMVKLDPILDEQTGEADLRLRVEARGSRNAP